MRASKLAAGGRRRCARSIHGRVQIRTSIKTALTSLESISRFRVPRSGAPKRHVNGTSPAGWQSCLPREVAVAAPKCQNDLPVPLTRDRGALPTKRGHPASRVALVTRLDQVALFFGCIPPRQDGAMPLCPRRVSRACTALATPALANSRSACGLLIRRPAIATPSSPLLDLGWVSRSAPRGAREPTTASRGR